MSYDYIHFHFILILQKIMMNIFKSNIHIYKFDFSTFLCRSSRFIDLNRIYILFLWWHRSFRARPGHYHSTTGDNWEANTTWRQRMRDGMATQTDQKKPTKERTNETKQPTNQPTAIRISITISMFNIGPTSLAKKKEKLSYRILHICSMSPKAVELTPPKHIATYNHDDWWLLLM